MTFKSKRIGVKGLQFLCALMFAFSALTSAAPAALKGNSAVRLIVMSHDDFVPDTVSNAAQIGVSEALASTLMQRLQQSQRFTLLDRAALRRTINEQRFGSEEKASSLDKVLDSAVSNMASASGLTVAAAGVLAAHNDQLKDFKDLGTAVGADYMVYMKIERISSKHKQTAIPYSDSGKKAHRKETKARLALRIIEVATSRIVGVESINTVIVERGKAAQESTTFDIYDNVVRIASAKIIDAVYPAKLVSDAPWVINRGANDGVNVGDEFQLIRLGQEIKDDGGVVIGQLESEVGRAKLTGVQGNLSTLEIISGQPNKGDLAKLVVPAVQPAVAPAAAVNKIGATSAELPRVAIGLVKAHSTAKTGVDASQHVPAFTDTLISQLTATKRFTLIDRQEVDQLLNEQMAQALAENRDMPSEMGVLKGADYLVLGSVSSFLIKEQQRKLPGSNRVIATKVGQVEGNMRIVDARSGDILSSRKVSVTEPLEVNTSQARTITKLADAYAEQVTLELMSAVYPIKVAAVTQSGQLYINRGTDGGLAVGETLTVYRLGEAITDPDSGIQLGREESKIAEVTLTEVEDNRSKATSEQASLIVKGDLLKRSLANKSARSSTKTAMAAPKREGAEVGKGKATLAVGKVLIGRKGNSSDLTATLVEQLTNDLYVKLVHTKRFDVLERAEIDQVLDQKAFTAISAGQQIDPAMAKLTGADYIIHATVNHFYLQTERKRIETVGRTVEKHKGHAEVTLRIVDVHTGKVVSAEKVNLVTDLSQEKNRRALPGKLLDQLSTRMVTDVVTYVYPIKVLGVTAVGDVYINRGADAGFREGDQFTVLRPGEALIDPDTGVSFGSAETEVATVKVSRVETARSVVTVVSGGKVQAGDILRQHKPKAQQPRVVRKVNKPSF